METNFINNNHLDFKISGKYLFNLSSNVLVHLTEEVKQTLGTNEANLLRLFIQNPGQVIPRSKIQKHVWEDNGFQVDDSSLTQAIFNLRKLFGDSSKSPSYILTVPRQGYKFIAPVEVVEPESVANNHSEPDIPDQNHQTSGDEPEISSNDFDESKQPEQKRQRFNTKAVLIFVSFLIFSVFIYFVLTPEKPVYLTIQTVDGIAVKSLDIQPENRWHDAIEECVKAFVQDRPVPLEVIVNGGQLQKLSINFVYDVEEAEYNQTLRLISRAGSSSFCHSEGVINE
jgi:cholera toxin transcriptional activator